MHVVLYLACAFFIVALSNIASALSSPTLQRSTYVVVVIGERVEMNCNITGNDSASWTCIFWKTSTEENIYLGKDIVALMRSRYKIVKGFSGQLNLIIDSVDLNHAGRYRCTATIQQSMINDVQLTVLGAEPGCDANTSETHDNSLEHPRLQLSMWCSINYTGDGFPVFNWSKSNDETVIAANTTTSVTSRRSVTYTSLIMQQLNANDNGVTFQCNIVFVMPNYSESYLNPWKFTLYGPNNLSIARHEDRLNCSADGNPTPIYRWTHIETNTSTDGSVLALNATFTSDKSNTFQCTAANIFGTENMNIRIKGATAEDAGVSQDDSITTVAICVSLLLLLIIAVIVLYVVCQKRLKDNASDRPDVALNTDISPYDEVLFSSDRTSDYIMEEVRLPGRSNVGMIVDNAGYSEVSKHKGRSNGRSGGDPGEKSRPIQTQPRVKKNFIGADGTEYAELSGVKPPDRKGEVPRPPAFSRVDVYASIDHNGRAPPPPPKF